MKKIEKYRCDKCGLEFDFRDSCAYHEMACNCSNENTVRDSLVFDVSFSIMEALQSYNPMIIKTQNSEFKIKFNFASMKEESNLEIEVNYSVKQGFYISSINEAGLNSGDIESKATIVAILRGVLIQFND